MQVTLSERTHIAFFGCTNAGKSSLVNAVTNQYLAVVSDVKGTTTDPVKKSMELLPLGPVVIIDTAGFDDDGQLGSLRIEKTKEILGKTDIAILVVDLAEKYNPTNDELIKLFKERNIPYIVTLNKCDLIDEQVPRENSVYVSAKTGVGIDELRELIAKVAKENKVEKFIIRDRLDQGDVVILVIPIDESAPKGRIILPQQNVLREIIDAHATAICCQVGELNGILDKFTPKFVITDSQVFNQVKNIVPESVVLTSFSILMANYKGSLGKMLDGAKKISELKDGDLVLISEACTHHRQCNDIGTVKFPKWIKDFTGKNIQFEFTQGGEFPEDVTKYSLIIHCGGCMINEAEMKTRMQKAIKSGVKIVNYGMAIAYMNGILDRSLEIFAK